MMTAVAYARSLHLYEMMGRLGLGPDAALMLESGLRYPTAVQRCEACRAMKTCVDWLEHAPAAVNLAPRFCMNADLLFELQCDQPGPRQIK